MNIHRTKSKDANPFAPPGPTFMTPEQVGQQPSFATRSASLLPSRLRSSSPSVSLSPNQAENSHKRWTADYLADLRTNRPVRPSGARPLPGRNATVNSVPALDPPVRISSAMAGRIRNSIDSQTTSELSPSALAHRRSQSTISPRENIGRPLAQAPRPNPTSRNVSTSTKSSGLVEDFVEVATDRPPKIPYYERGQRWMEKQETKSLTTALQTMDLEEQKKVHDAAQDEAADLVWKHRNPGATYANPDVVKLKEHLRKGSHARSQSTGPYESLYVTKGGSATGSRSASDGSNSNKSGRKVSSGSQASQASSASRDSAGDVATESRSSRYGSLRSSKNLFSRYRSNSAKRKPSGESGTSLFRNPEDQIYEEPEDVAVTKQDVDKPAPLRIKARNTSYTFKSLRGRFEKPDQSAEKKLSTVEIHRNPPSQSRNAHYTRNELPPGSGNMLTADEASMKDGKEIRSEDIRSATSRRLSDRSPKLPTPTAASDKPGRPIISFAPGYKPRKVELKHEQSNRPSSRDRVQNHSSKPPMPSATVSAPIVPTINVNTIPSIQLNSGSSIPTINVPDVPSISVSPSIPSINVPDVPSISVPPSVPSINVSETPSIPTINAPDSGSTRPLPKPRRTHPQPGNRPLPHHASTAPVNSNSHWSLAGQVRRDMAQCAACALPIAGKIVSAASQRFHPECFTCFHCGELLECVAFYPEPDAFRRCRLARIEARINNYPIPEDESHFTAEDDGDESMRFYCHLDFHETFSPRCRSCKTPIEGEVILACGGEWHVGHFFCAECGDPFDSSTPFVEKDGFAWCVNCHCKRYSGKCAGCKKPITDTVVKALDREWHENCFCCKECGSKFDDGRFFTRGESADPVCVRCEERRLKA